MKLKPILLTLCMTAVCMQGSAQKAPQLGVDPIDKVISAMTLDEKLNVLIGSKATCRPTPR